MRDWLSHRVVSSPDETALIRAEDGETWTYAELDKLVSDTAGRLAAHGIGPGDHLGVLMPAYVGTVGLVHAAMRLGATYVPLGERLTPRELSERIRRSDLTALVCAESTESDALAAVDDVPVLSVDEPEADSVAAVHGVDPVPVEPSEWAFEDRLCLLFTSGTTGEPKPVELTAGNVYASAIASAFRLGVDLDDRWLVALSLHHMGGLAPVYRSTLYGTTVVLREEFKPGRTADDIDTYDITGISLVPTMLRKTLDRRGTLADSLRVVLLGGAPASEELIERCRNYSVPVYPTYGMTEAASQIATATPSQARKRQGTVGRPLFGIDLTIVDEESPVEPGETGEIVVKGPTITPGYYGLPEINDEVFGPYGLHTGDVGRIDEDGHLYVLNRLDDRIITGGENVEPGEVSAVLADHPAVEEATVVGLEDDVWGERVAALVEVDPAAVELDQDEEAEDSTMSDDASGDVIDDTADDDAATDDGPTGDTEEVTTADTADADREATETADADREATETAKIDREATETAEVDRDAAETADADREATDTADADREAADTADSERETAVESGEDDESEREADRATFGEDHGNESVLGEEIVSFARERLAGFKLPRALAFTDDIPRTVSGTVDREAARRTVAETGIDIGTPEEPFDRAGFEPAEPEAVDDADDAEIPDSETRSEPTDQDDRAESATDGRVSGSAESGVKEESGATEAVETTEEPETTAGATKPDETTTPEKTNDGSEDVESGRKTSGPD